MPRHNYNITLEDEGKEGAEGSKQGEGCSWSVRWWHWAWNTYAWMAWTTVALLFSEGVKAS